MSQAGRIMDGVSMPSIADANHADGQGEVVLAESGLAKAAVEAVAQEAATLQAGQAVGEESTPRGPAGAAWQASGSGGVIGSWSRQGVVFAQCEQESLRSVESASSLRGHGAKEYGA